MRSPHAWARTLSVFSRSPSGGVWLVCNRHSAPFPVVMRKGEDPIVIGAAADPWETLDRTSGASGRQHDGPIMRTRHSLVGLWRIADRRRPRQQTAVINAIRAHLAEFGSTKHRPWLTALLARRPTMNGSGF